MRTLIVIFLIVLCPIYMWAQFDPTNPAEPSLNPPKAEFGTETYLNKAKFQNNSQNASRYEWDFGDGTPISKEKSPMHAYAKGGTYTVKLTAINGHAKNTVSQLVLIPSKEDWVLYGDITLDKYGTELTNYTSIESLFKDLMGIRLGNYLTIRVARGQTFDISQVADLTALKDQIISKIKENDYMDYISIQSDANTSTPLPILKLWSAFNKVNFDAFVELSEYLRFSNIIIQMGNEQITIDDDNLSNQEICSGNASTAMRFKNICSAFEYGWKLKSVPQYITGYQESGTNTIPAMHLANPSGERDTLVYEVTYNRNGEVYLTQEYEIAVSPSKIPFPNLKPQNGSTVDSPQHVTISWDQAWWRGSSSEFYIWEDGQEEPTSPHSTFYYDTRITLTDYCKENKTYNWKVKVTTGCSSISSDIHTFSISDGADLEVQSVTPSSSTLLSGERVSVKALIANRGKKDTGASSWVDELFISKEAVFNQETARSLGTYTHNGSLANGGQYEATFTVSVPRQEGTNYFFVETDRNHSVREEIDRKNNIKSSDAVTIQLTEQEKVGNMVPVNKELFSSTAITFSWKGSLKASTYRLYLWEEGTPEPEEPLVSGLQEFRYANDWSCQFDKSYLWKVSGHDEYGDPVCQSPTNTFSIKAAPDLHVTAIECGEAWAGKKLAVSWTVKNDGKEGTGDASWKDYIWLVPDISEGISGNYPQAVEHIKALSSGEIYTNTAELTINDRISGDYYVVVAADMSSITSIDWLPAGQTIPNPYAPSIQGTPYPYLKGAFYGKGNVLEANERGGQSDNFFYKKINIQVPDLPDLQVVSVVAPQHSLSGQTVTVVAQIANKGFADTQVSGWYDQIYISTEQTFNSATAQSLGAVFHQGTLPKGGQYTASFDVRIPTRYSGPCYFFVKTDIDDKVYEHANSENNTTASENAIEVIATPTADLQALLLEVPATGSKASSILIKGKATNRGPVDTDNHTWADYIFASENPERLDESAILIGAISHYGQLKRDQEYEIEGRCSLDKLEEGSYYMYLKVNANNQVSETALEDNVIRSASSIKIELPDLTITNLVAPDSLIAGKRYPISWTVQNNGADIENGSVRNVAALSNMNGDIIHQFDISQSFNLKAGASIVVTNEIYVPSLPENGDYQLSVKANTDGLLPEKDNNNNQSAFSSVRYERYEYDEKGNPIVIDMEDLSILSDCKLPEVMTSREYPIYWNVENNGDATCSTWSTDIYLSKSEAFNIYNSYLLKSIVGTSIEKEGIYQGETSISIPDQQYEMKYMFLVTTIRGKLGDANEADNVVMIPLNIVLAPTPDLKISNLDVPILIAGKKVTVSYEVENVGAGETHIAEWRDAVYLTASTSFANYRPIGNKNIQKTLKPGETYKETLSFDIPSDYTGNYSLYLKIDQDDALFELENKSNNIGQMFVEVISPSSTPTDLTVKGVSAPASYTVGSPVKICWTVQNGELYTAIGKLKDAIYLSKDNEWDSSDILVGTVSESVVIQPGQSVERTATGIINAVVPGTYYVIVRTNQLNAVKETDYENNIAVSTAVCSVDFSELAIGGNVSMTGQGFYKLTANQGESLLLHLESDGTQKGFNLYAAHNKVATLTEYEYVSAQPNDPFQEILIPEMKNGVYYILAQQQDLVSGVENNFTLGDAPAGPEKMSLNLSAQMLQFGISRINKAEGGNNGSATSAVMGAKFDSIMDYRLVRDGKVLPAEAVYFQHSSESLVTFNLNEVSTGTYDVVIEKNGGVKTEMKSGYTVVQDKPNKLQTRIVASSSFRMSTKNPITIEYANNGLSDVAVSELLLVSESGHPIALTSKELEKEETELHIPMVEPGSNQPASIASGGKGTITLFIHANSMTGISLKLYIVQ